MAVPPVLAVEGPWVISAQLFGFDFACGSRQLGQSEVQNLDLPLCGHEDVRWLDVAMNDALLVGGFQSVANLNGDVEQSLQRKLRPLLAGRFEVNVPQRLALQQLHHEEGLPFVLSEFVDGADIGMVQ